MRSAFVAVVATLVLAPAAGAASKPLPSVRIFALSPVQVRGAHFVAKERVKLTLHAGKATIARTAVASSKGAFVVSFGTISTAERCSGSVSVAARGAHQDGATYTLPSMECPSSSSGPTVTYSS